MFVGVCMCVQCIKYKQNEGKCIVTKLLVRHRDRKCDANNIISHHSKITNNMLNKYSGTSLLRSPTGLGKSDLIGEVTLLQGVICTVEYNLELSQGDCNGEVFLLVR